MARRPAHFTTFTTLLGAAAVVAVDATAMARLAEHAATATRSTSPSTKPGTATGRSPCSRRRTNSTPSRSPAAYQEGPAHHWQRRRRQALRGRCLQKHLAGPGRRHSQEDRHPGGPVAWRPHPAAQRQDRHRRHYRPPRSAQGRRDARGRCQREPGRGARVPQGQRLPLPPSASSTARSSPCTCRPRGRRPLPGATTSPSPRATPASSSMPWREVHSASPTPQSNTSSTPAGQTPTTSTPSPTSSASACKDFQGTEDAYEFDRAPRSTPRSAR